MNCAAIIEQLREAREIIDKLVSVLEATETDKFAAHLYQARRQYRRVSERPNKGNKATEREIISSYQVAKSLGFNGDFRAWEHLSRVKAYVFPWFCHTPLDSRCYLILGFKTMRILTVIFGIIAVLALAGFAATGRNAAICDTADCPASECP